MGLVAGACTAAPSAPPSATVTVRAAPPAVAAAGQEPLRALATVVAANHFVYVLGDSVLRHTNVTLPAALRGWRVVMNCVPSRRLTQGIPILRARTWRPGDTVVIDLGNNYIPGEGGTFASQIDRAMRAVHVVRRVVWVTVAEKWPSRVTINRSIRAARYRWPTIRVADWAPIVRAHPWYAYDQLHLTPSGQLAMAKLIASKVRAL